VPPGGGSDRGASILGSRSRWKPGLRPEPAPAFRIARLFGEPIEVIFDPDDATADAQNS
jgi:hypothetical protein